MAWACCVHRCGDANGGYLRFLFASGERRGGGSRPEQLVADHEVQCKECQRIMDINAVHDWQDYDGVGVLVIDAVTRTRGNGPRRLRERANRLCLEVMTVACPPVQNPTAP